MNAPHSNPPNERTLSCERKIIFLLCILAAIHVFVFSAAFPFFTNVDEPAHFDLVVKYSHAHLPRGLEPISAESARYIVIYSTSEYLTSPAKFPGGKMPPPDWTQPVQKIAPSVEADDAQWQKAYSWEDGQQPLYYAVAGAWWRLGQWLGCNDGFLLYWLRFLNILYISALVLTAYAAAKEIFPENFFLRLGVPALLAFLPQSAFYTIDNDVLSPLCFGVAFIFLVRWMRAEIPGWRLGMAAGFACAATFLTKMTNVPLLAVAAIFVLLKIFQMAKAGKIRAVLPSIISLVLCAGVPVAAWLIRTKLAFGDFAGTAAKVKIVLNWTVKPFSQWWHHPIFTPHGFWFFISNLMATFWQGELYWHGQPLAIHALNFVYALASVVFVAAAVVALASHRNAAAAPERRALWFCFFGFVASVGFLAFLSLIYDFHDCPRPSQALPYFTSGRMILGALIPFLLLFVYGIDRALHRFENTIKFFALAIIVVLMLAGEIITDWPVFFSQYNWYHM